MNHVAKWPTYKFGVAGPAFFDADYLPRFYKDHDDFNHHVLTPEAYAALKRQEQERAAEHNDPTNPTQ